MKLGDKKSVQMLAWILATALDESVADPKRAVQLATQACEDSNWKDFESLSTLAAAYARNEDMERAVEWQLKANAFATSKRSEALAEARLKSYRDGRSYHGP